MEIGSQTATICHRVNHLVASLLVVNFPIFESSKYLAYLYDNNFFLSFLYISEVVGSHPKTAVPTSATSDQDTKTVAPCQVAGCLTALAPPLKPPDVGMPGGKGLTGICKVISEAEGKYSIFGLGNGIWIPNAKAKKMALHTTHFTFQDLCQWRGVWLVYTMSVCV